MLRAVAFKNFIYFRDHQSLEFEDGPNFIVGQNASGKSAIFELIRRCLPNSANASISRLADTESPAFVICKFEIRQKLSIKVPKEFPAEVSIEVPKEFSAEVPIEVPAGCHVYSCVYINHSEKYDSKEMYKLVYITNTDEQQRKCYLEYYPSVSVCGPQSDPKAFTSTTESSDLPKKLDLLMKNELSLVTLQEELEKMKEDNQQSEISGCEAILKAIHDAVVVTFPIRSPGPIQWSHTKNIGKDHKHYDTALNNAEIIQELLDSKDVDEEESNQIFETIIHPIKYHFERNKDTKVIEVFDGAQKIPFLKVPEGIIEAKQFSLMFAHQKYQTLMLEEPGRGMHPSMIQKLRDLVLRRKNQDLKKVLVFISHQPAMINRWAMDRMYVCRRKRMADGKLKHSVLRLNRAIENIFQEQDKLKQMLYSSSVLFVEGITDKTIVESVFDRVLDAETLHGFTKEEFLNLQKVASGTQVISTDGSTQYNVLKTMGEKLELSCAFLFDSDVIFKCLPNIRPKQSDKKWRNSTLLCVRILLKRMKESFKGESVEESEKREREIILKQVMEKNTTPNGKKLQEALGLKEEDLSNVKWDTVVSFIQSVVLPATFVLKEKALEPYALNITDGKDNQQIRDQMKEEKNVFLWESGNLEDMICKSVLEFDDKVDEHHSKSPPTERYRNKDEQNKKKENLLQKLFLCEKYDERANNPKDPMKETIKQMDITTAENITECLLKSTEMKEFLKFLLQIKKKRPQLIYCRTE